MIAAVSSAFSEKPLNKKIAIFLPSLAAGGVARVMLQLAHAFVEAGHTVDLVLCKREGSFVKNLPPRIHVVELQPCSMLRARLWLLVTKPSLIRVLLLPFLISLKPPKSLAYLPDLIRYLKHEQPHALLSAKTHTNIVALWAADMVNLPMRVVVSERMPLSTVIQNSKKWRWRFIPQVLAHEYPKAHGIIAVSNGVKEELILHAGLGTQQITTIYNPVLLQHIRKKSLEPLQLPWKQDHGTPIIVGVGRLVPAKDFSTLLRAFALVRKHQPAHLIIVGEGRLRTDLTQLAQELGVAKDVWMPGFSDNPYAFMRIATALVLSSIYEGLPNVLLEALACGCPIISTNCSTGPSEILQNGKYGTIVPVGDTNALATALLSLFVNPPSKSLLQTRAADFDIQGIAQQYLQMLLRP